MGKVLAEGEAWVWDIEQSGAARVHCGAWELVGGGSCPRRSQVFTPRAHKGSSDV